MQRESAMFHVLDVGQGNLWFWASPAADILINASIPTAARGTVPREPLKYLQRFGASSPINLLVCTGYDADSVNEPGLSLVKKSFQLQEVWVPPLPEGNKAVAELIDGLKKARWLNGYIVSQLRGDLQRTFVCGDTKLTLFSPHPDDPKSSTQAPLVVRLEHDQTSVLVAADCDQHRWESIVYHFGPELKSDALVAPFHGSSRGIIPEALDFIRPSVVFVSAGSGPDEGPDRDAIQIYSQYVGGHIYVTSQRGNIRMWRTEGQIQLEWDRVAIA